MKTAILLQTHFFDSFIEAAYRRLKRACPVGWELFVALNCGDKPEIAPQSTQVPGAAFFLCSNQSLLGLPYPTKCAPQGWQLTPGNSDLISLLFLNRCPAIELLWMIEYDVHYEGDWARFFAYFAGSAADLLTTTIYRMRETPWKEMQPPFRSPSFADYPEAERLRAFLPIFRLSRRGFAAIDTAYRAGCGGHHEVTWPTILDRAGLRLEDIGGKGAWVRPENVNRFYFNTPHTFTMTPGTFVFRPPFTNVISRKNTLWHPVKPPYVSNWYPTQFHGSAVKTVVETAKPYVRRLLIWLWFLVKWNPLR